MGFPTETVYGLGADAGNSDSIKKIFQAKGRPANNPLIIHVATAGHAERIAKFNKLSAILVDNFWPGPLTLVLPLSNDSEISNLALCGQPTVAVRLPSHPVARQLLSVHGAPVAAPSANLSSKISPTRAEHVLVDLDGRIDAILDDGQVPIGLESTILAPSETGVELLRPGAITSEEIESLLKLRLESRKADCEPISPGQLDCHYAPKSPVRLNADSAESREVWLGFGPFAINAEFNLSLTGNLEEAAANLYLMMRNADEIALANGARRIAVSTIPTDGLGATINDRLIRAAHSSGTTA